MRPGRFPSLLLAFLSATLAATVLVELRGQTQQDAAMAPLPVPDAGPPAAVANRPAGPTLDQVARRVAASLARPLFSQSRRPLAASPATPGAPAPSLPRMAGVVVTPSGRQAIFVTKNDAKPLVVGEGGQVGVFTVQRILAGQVTLRGPEGERVLKPAFDPNPPAPSHPAPPQPAPGPAVPSALAIPGLPGFRS